ncbi:ethionine resistance protein [Basidiobolus ranarum]|uniref:Ethionine resistance protein n=1 Tax=Basidiobolus ranarum TaxID=34480 RepID=A0ABR2VUN0_9FUNG
MSTQKTTDSKSNAPHRKHTRRGEGRLPVLKRRESSPAPPPAPPLGTTTSRAAARPLRSNPKVVPPLIQRDSLVVDHTIPKRSKLYDKPNPSDNDNMSQKHTSLQAEGKIYTYDPMAINTRRNYGGTNVDWEKDETDRLPSAGKQEEDCLLALPSNLGRETRSEGRVRFADHHLEAAHEIKIQPLLSIKEEAVELVKMAMPLVSSYLLQYIINLAGVMILGRMGAEELGAATLASMFSTLTAFSPGIGLATALDTLCSQAYTGAHDVTIIGVYLQRAILFMVTLWGALGFVWFNAEWIFIHVLRQEPHLAMLASVYLRWLWPGMLPVLLFESIKRYLQAQGIMHASTIILSIVTPFTFLLTYLLVFWPPTAIGFIGAPIAYSISYTLVFLMIIGYVRYINGSEAWGGWSHKCLEDWGTFIRLAMPSIIVISAEFCAWELVTLATTFFGITALAAQSVLVTTDACLYQITLGWGVAASIRVGHYLGGNQPLHAKRAAHAATYISIVMGLSNALLLLMFRNQWAYIFINDSKVIQMVAAITPIHAACPVS